MNGELQAELQAERDARDAARMRHDARRHTYAVLYLGRAWRVEANLDAEYGAEWTLNEASMLADENATLTAQLVDYEVTKERLARERILCADAHRQISAQKAQLVQAESNLNATQKMLDATIAERDELHAQITALMTERDTLAAKLDAATARLAERENAALVAEQDDDATPATLGDRRQQETRSIKWTPPTRSKPDAAA